MTKVYAKIAKSLQILFLVGMIGLVTACAGGYGTPWGAAGNTGIVTNDPNSIPDIGWQTNKQRQVLVQQGKEVAKEVTPDTSITEDTAAPVVHKRKMSVSILLPLSGKRAEMGQSMLKAAQMALFDVGSGDFDLVPRDTKSTTDGAVAAASAAVNSKADLILGPIFAEDLKAIKPVTGPSNIPVVAFTTDWTLADSNTYIMGFLPFAQVARVARYAQSQGFERFSIYAPQTEYADVVVRTLQGSGVSVAHVNRYSPQQPDLSLIVKDFAERRKSEGSKNGFDFDALMLPMGSEGLKSLVTLLSVNKVEQPNIKFLGTGLWDEAGVTNDPSLFGGWYAAPDPNLRADFEKRYQDNYGVAPARLSSLAYDATALAAVISRGGEGDASPYTREAITNPRGFAGIDGIFRFRPDGLSERGLAILEVRSGRKVVVDKAPTAFIAASPN